MTDRERRYKVYSIEKAREKLPQINDEVISNAITVGADALVVAISFIISGTTDNVLKEAAFNLLGVFGVGHGLFYSSACIYHLLKKIGLEKEAKQFEADLEEKGKTR